MTLERPRIGRVIRFPACVDQSLDQFAEELRHHGFRITVESLECAHAQAPPSADASIFSVEHWFPGGRMTIRQSAAGLTITRRLPFLQIAGSSLFVGLMSTAALGATFGARVWIGGGVAAAVGLFLFQIKDGRRGRHDSILPRGVAMTSPWQPYRERLRTTLLRTVTLALILGAVVARLSGGGLIRWLVLSLLMLWPSFGGHWLDLWFINWLRPRLSAARGSQIAARLGVCFIGGVVLALGMALTALALPGFRAPPWPAWWIGGVAFIGLELAAHLLLRLRGRPSFYDGRG